jgi:acyl-CoA synthetase (AMP-forming)/AMP-acid ligase II
MSANGGQTPGRIFRSPWPDVDIPDVALGTYVLKRAQERADKPAIVDASSGRTLTYGQLAAGATRLARGLQQRGFGKGDVFAIFSPNLPEYAVAFFGVAATGAPSRRRIRSSPPRS